MNFAPVIGLLRRPATASGGQFPNGPGPTETNGIVATDSLNQ